MPEVTITLPDPAKTAALLKDAAAAAGSGGCNHTAGMHARWLADQIEEQVKPAIEEPEAFGSVVLAKGPWMGGRHPESIRWQRTPMHGKHYWESETGAVEVWSELTDVEVLRTGVVEAAVYPYAEGDVTVLGPETFKATDDSVISHKGENYYPRGDQELTETDKKAFNLGVDTGLGIMAGRIQNRLQQQLREAITSERKNALEKAIQAVEELAP